MVVLRVISVVLLTALIAASASPRNPSVAMCSSSSADWILEVACRWKARGASSAGMPLPLSMTRISRLPPASNSTVMREAPASIEFSNNSLTTDAGLSTTNPSVWAAGDVTGNPQFVYVAAASGNIAAGNALGAPGRELDLRTMPRVTFTTPSIASVGLTEQEARDAGHATATSLLPLDAVPRALVDRDTTGAVKLVADESSGELLGVHVMAAGAGDVIQAAVVAMNYHATIDEIAAMFHPYLTMAEALKLAAQTFDRDVSTLSCCAS